VRALSLFGVLLVAHLIGLQGRQLPLSAWSPIAFLWQDVLVALLFALVDAWIRRPRVGWTLYAGLVAYTAINVPITRVLSTPLTLPMLRAARGPLSDSITYYLTPVNLGAVGVVLAFAVVLPWLLTRLVGRSAAPGVRVGLAAVGVAIVAAGPFAVANVETVGLHRNAFGALLPARLPRLAASPRGGMSSADFRTSPFSSAPDPAQVSPYRGAAAGRNVVMIILESTASRYLRLYGADEDPTPNLTQFGSQALIFESAYAVYPESIRGLFSVLCSRYPLFGAPPDDYPSAPCVSIAAQLRDIGYRTALFHSGRFMYLGMKVLVENRGFDTLEDAGHIGGNVNSSFGVDEPSTVERMLAWVDALPRDQRFFLTYMPVAGHHPYATQHPGPFPNTSELGHYRNALHDGDAALGQLLAGLRARELDERTLYVIFGDHGEAFGQHQGNYGHSFFIYDENIRVPYLIAAPGLIEGQTRVRTGASLIDTAPTILDLLGLPAPRPFQGLSLLDPRPKMALFFTDYSLGFLGLRDACWKLIVETDSRRSKLYDVCADPGETQDVAAAHADRVTAYRARLEHWIAGQAR
jgi:hypothetical protein